MKTLKYNIRKYTINFSKKLAKRTNKKIADQKQNQSILKTGAFEFDNIDYKICKQQLGAIYEEKVIGIKIRSKCNCYEHSEKYPKFFFNLEKHRAIQSQMHSVIIKQDEITDQVEINKQIFSFYQSLFSRKVQIQTDEIEAYLENIPLPKLTNEQTSNCQGIISEDKIFKSLKSMENDKSPGNEKALQKKHLILLITFSYCKYFKNLNLVQILLVGLKQS